MNLEARPAPQFRPTATLDTLRLRAKLLAFVRRFFDEAGFWEVDTPVLSHERVIDPNIEPFVVPWSATQRLFLQTSPEFAMKRMIAAGADAIYQLGKVFRAGEVGRRHNPEFTMLEWYRVGDTHHDAMDFVERLLIAFLNEASQSESLSQPFVRLTYNQAFERHAGTKVLERSTQELIEIARRLRVSAPDSLRTDDRDGWLNLLLAECVEPHLGRDRPTFVYDYPASQAALARIRGDGPAAVAERFELYVGGMELCNGYHELTDAAELQSRIRKDAAESERLIPEPERLLAAMRHGLPNCAGVALGFDRLVMLAINADCIGDVVPFPLEHA